MHSCEVTCERSESARERRTALYKSDHHQQQLYPQIDAMALYSLTPLTEYLGARGILNALHPVYEKAAQCCHRSAFALFVSVMMRGGREGGRAREVQIREGSAGWVGEKTA